MDESNENGDDENGECSHALLRDSLFVVSTNCGHAFHAETSVSSFMCPMHGCTALSGLCISNQLLCTLVVTLEAGHAEDSYCWVTDHLQG